MADAILTRDELRKRWPNFLQGIANDLTNELIRTCPVDKGSLRQSIKYVVQDSVIRIKMLYYGLIIEFGSPPHIIRPRTKDALHWKVGNKDIFAKVVHHPGTRPNPFIRTALRTRLAGIVINNARRHFT